VNELFDAHLLFSVHCVKTIPIGVRYCLFSFSSELAYIKPANGYV